MERPLYNTMSPLRPYRGEFKAQEVIQECGKVWRLITRSSHWNAIRRSLSGLNYNGNLSATAVHLHADAITAEMPADIDLAPLRDLCRSLISWRTGPFQLGDFVLDTEWQSHMKWGRVAPMIPQKSGLRIADVGCGNGYFLYKLATLDPELAIGFDPIERCWLQFALLQSIMRVPKLAFLPMGILALDAFPSFFDFILCMGVIYHQRDQALAVKRLYDATRPGGHVLMESLVVPHDEPLVVTPPDRYAKMRNSWTIPSAASLMTLFLDAGFHDVQVKSFGPLTPAEQRRTVFAPFESLADFLDPHDSSRTIEGHPAPHTAAVIGRR